MEEFRDEFLGKTLLEPIENEQKPMDVSQIEPEIETNWTQTNVQASLEVPQARN